MSQFVAVLDGQVFLKTLMDFKKTVEHASVYGGEDEWYDAVYAVHNNELVEVKAVYVPGSAVDTFDDEGHKNYRHCEYVMTDQFDGIHGGFTARFDLRS